MPRDARWSTAVFSAKRVGYGGRWAAGVIKFMHQSRRRIEANKAARFGDDVHRTVLSMNPITSTNGHGTSTPFYSGSKRLFDVLSSGFAMCLLPPTYVIVSVLLRLGGGSHQPGSARESLARKGSARESLARKSSARRRPSQRKVDVIFRQRRIGQGVGHSPLAGYFGISPLPNGSAREGVLSEIRDR